MDECIRVYEILVNYSIQLFSNLEINLEFSINKLVICGDSAGGLMVLDILKHCVKTKQRIPEGCLLAYPCSRIIIDSLTPSILLCLEDTLIDNSILSKIQTTLLDLESVDDFKKYENDDRLNFYLTDSKIVEKFPTTLILASTNDPVRDECYKLADFMHTRKVNVRLKEFLYYCHGFLNLGSIFDSYYLKGINEGMKFIKNIFDGNKFN